MAEVAAPAIFVATLFLVLRRPKNIDTGLAALIGGLAALLAGVVTPPVLLAALAGLWAAMALAG